MPASDVYIIMTIKTATIAIAYMTATATTTTMTAMTNKLPSIVFVVVAFMAVKVVVAFWQG